MPKNFPQNRVDEEGHAYICINIRVVRFPITDEMTPNPNDVGK